MVVFTISKGLACFQSDYGEDKPHSGKLDLIFQMVRTFIWENEYAVKASRMFCSLQRAKLNIERKLNIASINTQTK